MPKNYGNVSFLVKSIPLLCLGKGCGSLSVGCLTNIADMEPRGDIAFPASRDLGETGKKEICFRSYLKDNS